MKRLSILVLILVGLTALSSGCCDDGGVTVQDGRVSGSGNVVSVQTALADFTFVEAANAFEVDITQSDTFSVTIRLDDNILDLVEVYALGDTLRLRLERGVSLRGAVTLEAEITMPELEGLKLSDASSASVSGFRSSGQLDIGLSGASSLDGDLETGDIDINASGASKVALDGSATGLTIEGSGASSLDLADFTVDTAEVKLSGASDATVRAQERIDPVDVSGASRLRYLGDPSLGDVTTSGASTVDKIED